MVMARRRQTRLRMPSGVIATLDGQGDSPWTLDPEREDEHALLNSLVDRLGDEGKTGPSNPNAALTIAEAARDLFGATILEVEPPESVPGRVY